MNNKRFILLKTLLLSTSRVNKAKYSRDKKTKNKAIGGLVGVAIIYLMIVFYCIAAGVGYGYLGLYDSIPVICAATISALAFVFTFFKTNGYLFAFKEYDMLMSLPFSPKTIAADKFLYMYMSSLPWYLSILLSMMVAYGVYAKPGIIVYILWIVLGLILPVVPMLFAAFLGFIIAKISAGFRHKNIIQTVLTFVFVLFCFSFQYIVEAVVKSDDTKEILSGISDKISGLGNGYLPIAWFSEAVLKVNLLDAALLIALSLGLFELLFILVGKNYREINSRLKTHGKAKKKSDLSFKKQNLLNTIAFKEFKRLGGNTTYLVNATMGLVLAIILGLASAVFSFDRIIQIITKDAPFDAAIVYPAIPLIVYYLTGMMSTCACTPSLEGKNYWIVQSLPIEKKTLYQGKMLFNVYLTVPVAIFTTLCLSISARVPVLNAIIYLIEVLALSAFSSSWGCVCGIKHRRLDWENEIEVVKQGTAVALYLLPNMFVVMGLVVGVVALSLVVNSNLISILLTCIALILALLSYRRVISLAKKEENI